jgi:spermidine/putrescine-binding protein
MLSLSRTFKLLMTAAIGASLMALPLFASKALAQDKKTNIVVIWGDDIGQSYSATAPSMCNTSLPVEPRVSSPSSTVRK